MGREGLNQLASGLVKRISSVCTALITLDRDGVEVVTSDDPISCWSAIEEACEEVIIYGVNKSGGTYLVQAKCVSLNTPFVFEVNGGLKPFMIHPILALFKDEAFVDEGSSSSFT